jgi:formate-dependent nitrite reductase membrane component NrfD
MVTYYMFLASSASALLSLASIVVVIVVNDKAHVTVRRTLLSFIVTLLFVVLILLNNFNLTGSKLNNLSLALFVDFFTHISAIGRDNLVSWTIFVPTIPKPPTEGRI